MYTTRTIKMDNGNSLSSQQSFAKAPKCKLGRSLQLALAKFPNAAKNVVFLHLNDLTGIRLQIISRVHYRSDEIKKLRNYTVRLPENDYNNNNNNILRFTRCANLNKIITMLRTELYTLTLSKG